MPHFSKAKMSQRNCAASKAFGRAEKRVPCENLVSNRVTAKSVRGRKNTNEKRRCDGSIKRVEFSQQMKTKE
jgi:hypothetical protein